MIGVHPHPPANDPCRLCGASARKVCVYRVLDRYPIGYYQCPACDLIQTQHPFWLDEAYRSALSDLDTGAVERDRISSDLTIALAGLLRVEAADPCLDYGGGHGVLTRALRDRGYDFRWHDKYAANLYARGFEGDPCARHKLLTCFEVWEHLPDVGADLRQLFSPGHDALLVSTVLHRGHRENWWYYCPQAGQHVAFFSARTMQFIASRFGCEAIIGARHTLFHRPGVLAGWRRRLAAMILRRARPQRNSRAALLGQALRPRLPGRIWSDHLQLMTNRQTPEIVR